MSPDTIQDLWLVVTAISTVILVAIVIFKWIMFRRSGRYYFLSQAILLAFIAHEQLSAEVKNYLHPSPPDDAPVGYYWLIGRILETVVAAAVLGYMVFGRNGQHKTD